MDRTNNGGSMWWWLAMALAQDCGTSDWVLSPFEQRSGTQTIAWNLLPIPGEMLTQPFEGSVSVTVDGEPLELQSRWVESPGPDGRPVQAWSVPDATRADTLEVSTTPGSSIGPAPRVVRGVFPPPPTVTLLDARTSVTRASACRTLFTAVDFSLGESSEADLPEDYTLPPTLVQLQTSDDPRFAGELDSRMMTASGEVPRQEGHRYLRLRAWSPGHAPGPWSEATTLRRGCSSTHGGSVWAGLLVLLWRRRTHGVAASRGDQSRASS